LIDNCKLRPHSTHRSFGDWDSELELSSRDEISSFDAREFDIDLNIDARALERRTQKPSPPTPPPPAKPQAAAKKLTCGVEAYPFNGLCVQKFTCAASGTIEVKPEFKAILESKDRVEKNTVEVCNLHCKCA
jgi:hypothetical protein